MTGKLNCILMVDDNKIDNFFHERIIRKNASADTIIATESGYEALDYLSNSNNTQPDIIFLDINMPGMSGWEFAAQYKLLPGRKQDCLVVFFISRECVDEKQLALIDGLKADFREKPLTKELLEELLR
jgi:CheY-like chemotaxis protein